MQSFEKYIEWNIGTFPIIISVPHGGVLDCIEIPKRSKGIMGIDKATINLAKELIKSFSLKNSKLIPSYIFSKVRRNKIDLNRDESTAFNKNSLLAKQIYRFYHSKVREIIDNNLKRFNTSILIDIHGFEKYKRPPGYRDVEIVLGTDNLNTLKDENLLIKERDKNLRGKLIRHFNALNIPIAPGRPKRKEYILTGGYIVQQYGANVIRGSKSIQIEFSDTIRIHDEKLRKICLKIIRDVLLDEIN